MSKWKRVRRQDGGSAPPDGRCAFCERSIAEDQEVFGFGIKAVPGVDLSKSRGRVIEMVVESLGRDIPVIVTTTDSPAATAGYDFYVMTCSDTCATDLKAALDQDIHGERRLE
jgi:hypothetical protein